MNLDNIANCGSFYYDLRAQPRTFCQIQEIQGIYRMIVIHKRFIKGVPRFQHTGANRSGRKELRDHLKYVLAAD